MLLHHPALRGFFLQFHTADAPSEAEADIARIETVVVGRGMIGVEASRARGAAARMNYDNVSYLCRFFRNATGQSMMEFRRKQR